MPPKQTPSRLRSFLEEGLGLQLDPKLIARFEKGFGTTIDDDPGRWNDVQRKLTELWGEDPDAFEAVEPVFQRLHERHVTEDPATGAVDYANALAAMSPATRAVLVTRIFEGEIDNGGWFSIFYNDVDGLIEPAASAYELLDLPGYATHLRRVLGSGFKGRESQEELGKSLEEEWFSLTGSEEARARLIQTSPELFE